MASGISADGQVSRWNVIASNPMDMSCICSYKGCESEDSEDNSYENY